MNATAATVATTLPPGPRELPLVGSAFQLMREPLDLLLRLAREHGDVARFSLPGQRVWLVSHPDLIEAVLQHQNAHLIRDKLTREVSLVAGNGLLTSEGAFWKRQRLLAQPAFHHKRIQSYGDVMVGYAEHAAARWHAGQHLDIYISRCSARAEVVLHQTRFGR